MSAKPEDSDTLVAFGGELKALPNGHIGGYLVRFSGPADPDLTGDYFTKATDFGIEPGAKTPVYFHHRLPLQTREGATIRVKKKIGEATLSIDDQGVLIDAILFNREQYEKDIAKSAKSLGWSSGTAAHLVDREQTGKSAHITTWYLGLDASVTPTPAEPRNHVVPLKSLSINTDASAENDTEQNSDVSPAADSETNSTEQDNRKGLTDMTPEEIAAMLDARDAAKEAKSAALAKAQADQAEAIKAAVAAERKVWEAEMKGVRRGSYAGGADDSIMSADVIAEIKSSDFYKSRAAFWHSSRANLDELKAVATFVKTGDASGLKASNATDMNIGTPADGGYAVPTGHYRGIIARCDEDALDGPLGLTKIPGIGTTVNVPIEAGAANEFVLTAEAAQFDLDAPVLGQAAMTLLKYTKDIFLSVELLNDEDSNLMAFLESWVGRALARTKNHLLVTALVAGATAQVTSLGATFAAADVVALSYGLKECYNQNAKWLMRNATEGLIRGLTGNPFLFYPTPMGQQNEIYGHPVYHSEFVAAPALNAVSGFYGDFSYVGYREAPHLDFLRDPYSRASTGQVVLHYYTRQVYKVLQGEAITKITNAAA